MTNISVSSLISYDSMETTSDFIANLSSTTAPSIIEQSLALYHNRRRFLFSGIVLLLGVIGNALALAILARKKATKNSKYTLLLRCLVSNNLIGLLGILTTIMLKIYVPEDEFKAYVRWDCTLKVLCRFFGLSSGCIAAVMAIERFMALARPFIYHKHITYALVRKTINILVFIAVVVTFLPFTGFGAYIDESNPTNPKCLRYRDAEGFWNKTYSVLFMSFGTLLCIVIVACNLFVTRALCVISRKRASKRHIHYDTLQRETGSIQWIEGKSNSSGSSLYHRSNSGTMTANTSPDEIKFAKLMALLSICFVICWMPQMIAIPMAILPNRVPKAHPFFILADVLMALNFTFDPYIYVLSRTKQSHLMGCIKDCRCWL
ncbi:PREDICTED: prostaglandin E2 receptor EP2 subtype-like [Bactrocera latifrons]|uniref:prostaglandin E2 receptor EP2 subtype-like n=1 Tax=Bactrocera latifrons TaxID=174628 RepID=UPI0008DCCEBE|nr:PREDICTED: prostaglandin E2 receptor EP2 subtype-like [Bactrocera latifrons]